MNYELRIKEGLLILLCQTSYAILPTLLCNAKELIHTGREGGNVEGRMPVCGTREAEKSDALHAP